MQTILLIIILIMALFILKQAVKLNQLEEKTLEAFRIICDEVRANKEKVNSHISQFSHEEASE